jgi:uncharacterized alkaline shock family protein YloU
MAAKTDKKPVNPLPVNTDDLTPSSNITYNNEVVAIIAGLAANEVEGIAGMCTVSSGLKNKNRNVTKGVKVEVGTEEVAVDLYVIVEYGIPIQRAAGDAQENVRKAIESMTGLHVVRVDVHVQSVSFEQEKKALQAGVQNAALVAGEMEQEKKPEKQPETKKKTEPAKQTEPAKTDEPVKASEPVKVSEPVKKNESGKKAEPAKATKEKPASKSKTEKTEADSAPKTRKTVKKSEDKKEETKGTSEA